MLCRVGDRSFAISAGWVVVQCNVFRAKAGIKDGSEPRTERSSAHIAASDVLVGCWEMPCAARLVAGAGGKCGVAGRDSGRSAACKGRPTPCGCTLLERGLGYGQAKAARRLLEWRGGG